MSVRSYRAIVMLCALLGGFLLSDSVANAGAPSVYGTVSRFDIIPRRTPLYAGNAAPSKNRANTQKPYRAKSTAGKQRASRNKAAKVRAVKKPVRATKKRVVQKARKRTQTAKRPARQRVAMLTKPQAVPRPQPKPARQLAPRKSIKGYAALRALIRHYAIEENVPVELAYAVAKIESNYRTHVTGPHGSIGMMQIKYTTARGLGYRGTRGQLYHPEPNVKFAMKYLSGAFRRAKGDICRTVFQYNAGYYAKRMNPISARYCRRAIAMVGKRHISPQSIIAQNNEARARLHRVRVTMVAEEREAQQRAVDAFKSARNIPVVLANEKKLRQVRVASLAHMPGVSAIAEWPSSIGVDDALITLAMAGSEPSELQGAAEGAKMSSVVMPLRALPVKDECKRDMSRFKGSLWTKIADLLGVNGAKMSRAIDDGSIIGIEAQFRRCG